MHALRKSFALLSRLLLAGVFLPAGISKIGGLGAHWASLRLALFTHVASLFFHNLRAMAADQQFMHQLMFMKNIGIVGGLLALTALGAGAFSLGARSAV